MRDDPNDTIDKIKALYPQSEVFVQQMPADWFPKNGSGLAELLRVSPREHNPALCDPDFDIMHILVDLGCGDVNDIVELTAIIELLKSHATDSTTYAEIIADLQVLKDLTVQIDSLNARIMRLDSTVNYKSTEQVQAELASIDPRLAKKYKLFQVSDSVRGSGLQLIRQGTITTSIVCFPQSYGGNKGLYEIYPDRDGIGLAQRFGQLGITDNVIGNLTIKDAIAIAEAAEKGGPELEALVRKHMYVDVPKAS